MACLIRLLIKWGQLNICLLEVKLHSTSIKRETKLWAEHYHIAQNFDGAKVWRIWRIKHFRKFDEQNFDELIVTFIGKVLKGKDWKGKLWRIVRHSSNLSDFCTVKVLRYTVANSLILSFSTKVVIIIVHVWLSNS